MLPSSSISAPIQQVMPSSAAEKAGLLAGDVLVAFDGESVNDLRGYSTLLKAKSPGDEVEVTVLRNGVETVVTAILGER